jgi:AcrR family transcriptional regulator
MWEDRLVGEAETTSARDSLAFRDERSREAIVDAGLGLYHRGVRDPTALEIADQAGVSLRSVYYHFADLESLALEAVARQRAQVEPLLAPPITTGPLDDRIVDLVERRCELFEVVTPVRRAALLLRHRSPTIDENLTMLAKVLRDQVATTFAAELAIEDEQGTRCSLLDALDLVTSWEAWERLRASQSLTRDRARAVLQRSLRALLVPPGPA